MRFATPLAALAVLMSTATGLLAKDVALVIANTDLINSRSERNATVRALPSLLDAYARDGYEVISGRNAGPEAMAELLETFEAQRTGADRLVIHYIGLLHASKLTSHLQSADSGQRTLVSRHYAHPSLALVYELLSSRPGRSALVLSTTSVNIDQWLVTGPQIPQGLLVLSGTPEDMTVAMRDEMLDGAATGRDMQRQRGISAMGFVSDMTLEAPEPDVAVTPQPSPGNSNAVLVEMETWRLAAQSGTEASLQSYLDRYPRGLFVSEAKARLAALVPQISTEEQIETALNLSRNDRRGIQANLTLLGFNTRGVDGLFGRGSRTAIGNWQTSEGFRSTGFLDRAQIRLLNAAADAKKKADQEQKDKDDLAYWQQTGSNGSENGLKAYLDRYPDGLFAPQAKSALDRIIADKKPDTSQLEAAEAALGLNGQTRVLAERRLQSLGYDTGRVDGQFDNKTRRAIAQFQTQANLPSTGYLNERTVTLLVASIFR